MKLSVDKEADALYLRLDNSRIVETEEVSPGVMLDFNEAGEVVGVEMLYLSRRSPNLDWTDLHFKATQPSTSKGGSEAPSSDRVNGKA